MSEKLWNLLTTFSDEAKQAALAKCNELSFDQTRGVVSLEESYLNLHSACNLLRDSIEQGKFDQIPISIQNLITASLDAISKHQTSLIGGADEVVNLVNAIEKLNSQIWQFGLHNLSGEVLGYQEKLNQLKNLELAALAATKQLQEGIQVKNEIDGILGDAHSHSATLQHFIEKAATVESEASDLLNRISDHSDKSAVGLSQIQQAEAASNQLLANSTASNLQIQTQETNINNLVSAFAALKDELDRNKAKQVELFKEFEEYRKKIDDLLADANRTGMAASFTNRSKALILPMLLWLLAFAASIYGLIYMGTTYIVPLLAAGNWEQLLPRMALTAPVIWLGWFSAKQYGYTSRLRQDYAYKEASAKAFEGYKREASNVDPAMLKSLMETAIKNFGDNPIRIYNGHENHASPLHELFERSLKDEKLFDLFKAIVSKAKS